jgi:Uma2 family endonuclease
MSSVAQERLSPEEYLRRERIAETKSEYDDGIVYAMSGASRRHNLIVAGLIRALGNQLRRGCEVYPSDMRVRISKANRYYYPDVSIVCGEAQFADNEFDNLLNPLIVFEVLSESTMSRDRGRKFLGYQTIDSLQDYVLVSLDEYLIEHFRRHQGEWSYTVLQGIDGTLALPAAQCELSLRDIYYQVELP